MFPFVTDFARQNVYRPRFKKVEGPKPAIPAALTKPHSHWREQRDADHVTEFRLILMPADSSAWAILVDSDLTELFGTSTSKSSNDFAQNKKEGRRLRGSLHASSRVVVPHSK